MNYEAVAETIRADYNEVTLQYRRDDEIEVATENHRRLCAILKGICNSFPHPIKALDVGCGTGRYFHCLTNVSELIGIDISEEMLRAAETPVRSEEVPENLRLVCANAFLLDFPPASFHFIYSLGMFSNGCPVTTELCNRFHRWLAPGGKLFFDAVDMAGQPFSYRFRRQVRKMVYPMLARRWQTALDKREAQRPFFDLTRRELETILDETEFATYRVNSERCESPLWTGRHLECVATKAG
jgi:ubiquinone/menaquinone biosynthesis C-methylase UbiE